MLFRSADLAKSLEAVSVKQWQPGSEQREANIQTAAQANIAIAFAEDRKSVV